MTPKKGLNLQRPGSLGDETARHCTPLCPGISWSSPRLYFTVERHIAFQKANWVNEFEGSAPVCVCVCMCLCDTRTGGPTRVHVHCRTCVSDEPIWTCISNKDNGKQSRGRMKGRAGPCEPIYRWQCWWLVLLRGSIPEV